MKQLLLLSLLWFGNQSHSQILQVIDSSRPDVSFRGLSITGDGSIWVSGSKGTVGKSEDGGKNWHWIGPKGYSDRDFRDVEASDKNTALVMAIDSPGIILKTVDGGISWTKVYENHAPDIFLDDMCFRNKKDGICAGDPLNDGRLVLIATTDGGESWQMLPDNQRPLVQKGEALFAASGGNMIPNPNKKQSYLLVTGGTASRLWKIYAGPKGKQASSTNIPIQQGGTTSGANAIFGQGKYLMIVGGDFSDPPKSDSAYATRFKDRPMKGSELAGGYKSSIADNGNSLRVACGTTGVAVHRGPFPGYPTPWITVTPQAFHVVRSIPGSGTFWLAGPGGRIARLLFD